MRVRILVMLLLAVVCGGASLVMARAWLDGQESARLKAIESVVDRPGPEFGSIVVAAEPLRFGAVLTAGNLRTIPWPDGEVPPSAFRSVEEIVGGEPRSVLSPLEPSEPVLAAKITGPGERAGLARLITGGHRAVTVRVNDVAGVAGFVLPGDRVDVVLTVERDRTTTTHVILQNVRVLSIDQVADERASEPVVAKAVTLEVDPPGAQKISLAQSLGALSLSLRPSGEADPAEVAAVTLEDVIGAGRQTVMGEAPVAAAPVEAPRRDTATAVSVTRAMVSTEYRVPAGEAEAAGEAPASVPAPAPAVADRADLAPAPIRRPAPAEARAAPAAGLAAAARPKRPASDSRPVAVLAAAPAGETGSILTAAPAGGHILDLPIE